ncbi:MAG TPA: sodium:proton antiporter NhaD [Steroidobacteraceae bacterium]|nr:sodium:proton antiporter NhaD [Steroidobacteraceae bacterium]
MTGAAELAGSGLALLALVLFVLAYVLVIAEEFIHLRKSKPVVIAAGVIWILVGVAALGVEGMDAAQLLEHNLLEYAGLLLFLLAAMTYVNTLDERNVFAALRSWMVARRFSLRRIYWLTGALAFAISPLLDNLTTAMVMGAVALNVGRGDRRFLVPACINIVIAANAGGAFSPFGDITTLMVWQKGVVKFAEFFDLFLPALVNWLVPALCMHFAVPTGSPAAEADRVHVKAGGFVVIALFGATVAFTVVIHQWLHLPSYLGMMTGLGMLMLYGHVIRRRELAAAPVLTGSEAPAGFKPAHRPFDVFISAKRVEWDTLLFFYGVVLCVGGLGAFGYLSLLSQHSYTALGPSITNIAVGLASAVIDNIPIMYAVLTMNPEMSHGHWLLVTLTAGVGGSLLSVGSAAGVALMGQARGIYTFVAHLKWIWAILLGYAASIWVHFALNAALF